MSLSVIHEYEHFIEISLFPYTYLVHIFKNLVVFMIIILNILCCWKSINKLFIVSIIYLAMNIIKDAM